MANNDAVLVAYSMRQAGFGGGLSELCVVLGCETIAGELPYLEGSTPTDEDVLRRRQVDQISLMLF